MNSLMINEGEYPNQVPHNIVASVCMVTYNHAPYISQAIESVLMQETDFAIELCIGEDRSTDGTREICLDYAKRFPKKIRLLLRSEEEKSKGKGLPAGRWNGFLTRSSCRGEFIALLEGDDFWIHPKKLQKQVEYLRVKLDCNICATRALCWASDINGVDYINPSLNLSKLVINDLLNGNGGLVNTCTLCYRRNSFEEWFNWSKNIIGGDWALLVTSLNNGSYCQVLPFVGGVYRIHSRGAWRGKNFTRTDKLEIILSYLRAYKAYASCDVCNALHNKIKYYEAAQAYYTDQGLFKFVRLLKRIIKSPYLLWKLYLSAWYKFLMFIGGVFAKLFPNSMNAFSKKNSTYT